MKTPTSVIVLLAWLTVLGAGCASGGQQQQSQEQINADGGEQTNGEDVNNASLSQEQENGGEEFAEAEAVNNAADNEFAEGQDDQLNLANNESLEEPTQQAALATNTGTEQVPMNYLAAETNPTANAAAALNLGGQAAAPANEAAGNLASALDPAATIPPATDMPPVPEAAPMPTDGGMVKYVLNMTPASDQPGGTTLETLNQGDHPVVWAEGQYARMSNGRYVSTSSLSDRGVGRPRNGGDWRLSAGGE